jgi:hypothetical protein
MKRVLVLSFAAGVAAVLAGCGPLGSPGALQNGRFGYVCGATVTDLGCGDLASDTVPGAIAVGAHFDVQYTIDVTSDGPVPADLAPAAPAILVPEAASEAGAFGFRFASPRVVALLANTTDSGVADFIHLNGVALDHVAITLLGGSRISTLALSVNGPTSAVAAEPLGAEEQPLAGNLVYTWAVADPTVVSLSPFTGVLGWNRESQMTIVPLKAGTTTVTASANGMQASVTVTVQ